MNWPIFLLQVEDEQIMQDLFEENGSALSVSLHKDAYDAARGTHALVVCTEWDQFLVLIEFPTPLSNTISLIEN